MRTFDAERVNFLVNHPAIRPFIGGDGESEMDLAAVVADEQNVFLGGEHGGFACCWSAPGIYEVHTFILPEGRGEWAYQFARAGRDYMQDYGARLLWTRVHPDAHHVRRFTLKAGFSPAGQHRILGVTYDLFDWRPSCQQQ